MTRPPLLLLPDGRNVPYKVVRNPRSKHVLLRLDRSGQLTVTAPPTLPERALRQLVAARGAWVLGKLQQLPAPEPLELLPQSISLLALGEEWTVSYSKRAGAQLRLQAARSERTLLVTGDTAGNLAADASADQPGNAAYRELLRRWLARRGREQLVPWLERLSQETGLPFRKVSIRGQRTRWGSYSARGDVSLNWKLLFLPARLVRHVLIHELCHALEMNHSPRFWQHVARFEDGVPELRRQLRSAAVFVPDWIDR